MRKLHYFIKFLISVIVAVSFISAGTLEFAGAAEATSGKVAAYRGVEHDWGYINIKGGNLQHTFSMYNSGEDNLLLKGGFTSCGCTKLSITLPDGSKSPEFGMSLLNNWIGLVKPGESFKITIDYDPLAHGLKDLGPVERRAYLITSAPHDDRLSNRMQVVRNGTVTTFRVSGVVVSEEEFKKTGMKNRYKKEMGDFSFRDIEYDFGVLKQSQGITRYGFPFIYRGAKPITITGTPTSCGCTRASISKERFNPGDEGILTVEFDPNLHKEPVGKFFKTISILTDIPQKERVEVRIWAEIDEDLGHDAYKQKEHKD